MLSCFLSLQVLTLMSGDYKVLSDTIKARQAETPTATEPTAAAVSEVETDPVAEAGDEDSRPA